MHVLEQRAPARRFGGNPGFRLALRLFLRGKRDDQFVEVPRQLSDFVILPILADAHRAVALAQRRHGARDAREARGEVLRAPKMQ